MALFLGGLALAARDQALDLAEQRFIAASALTASGNGLRRFLRTKISLSASLSQSAPAAVACSFVGVVPWRLRRRGVPSMEATSLL